MNANDLEELLIIQRAMKRVCFDGSPSESDLKTLVGDPARMRMYREMVRMRLRELAESAFPATRKALGPETFQVETEKWLTARPPRSRYLRELAGEFSAWASDAWGARSDLPVYVADLLKLEAAKWECIHGRDRIPAHVDEFDFAKVPLVDPGARLLLLGHAVHEIGEDAPRAGTFYVCVHRSKSHHGAELWNLNRMAFRLLEGWQRGTETATATVARVLQEDGTNADAAFIEALGGVLASMIERDVVLGST